jgi:hypothetical protein
MELSPDGLCMGGDRIHRRAERGHPQIHNCPAPRFKFGGYGKCPAGWREHRESVHYEESTISKQLSQAKKITSRNVRVAMARNPYSGRYQ